MLWYLYGIVRGDMPDPPPELRGIEGGGVRLIRSGTIAGIVGELPAEEYAGDVLDARLADLDWVGVRGVAHEAVLTWFVDRGPVIPLQPFSLHRSRDAVLARLSESEASFSELLERLAGYREWGVKLWRIEASTRAHLEELSPSIAALADEIRTATPGRRFLLEKKKEALSDEELRTATMEVARHVHESLAGLADSSALLAIPAAQRRERALVLHAAYLVADAEFDGFQHRVSQLATRFGKVGFECEFTGPWPPYHFART